MVEFRPSSFREEDGVVVLVGGVAAAVVSPEAEDHLGVVEQVEAGKTTPVSISRMKVYG